MPTFADLLSQQVRRDSGRPLVTFYDQRSDERVELSVATYANWVAKVAGLLIDEHDLGRGDTLRLDLPTHWLGVVFLGAAWTAGLVVDLTEGEADAVVCGPQGVETWAARADDVPVLACSLLPLGVRFREPLPPGVHDVGVEVWSQPDSFAPYDPPSGADVAVRLPERELTHDQMWKAAADGTLIADGGRLLTVANPASPPGLATFTEPLVRGGSVVLVAHPVEARLDATYAAERATARFLGDVDAQPSSQPTRS